jgi:hypothetical protein
MISDLGNGIAAMVAEDERSVANIDRLKYGCRLKTSSTAL